MKDKDQFDYLLEVLDNPCLACLAGAVIVELYRLL